MVSLMSLSTELKLGIIEHLDTTSDSFIPAPSQDLLNLSQVCTVLRTLALPFLIKSLTLLNTEKSGSSALTVLQSENVKHVRTVHYVGIMAVPEEGDETKNGLHPDDFPSSVEQVLSGLENLPSLEQVTIQFVCDKDAGEDEEIYTVSLDMNKDSETEEQVLAAEATVPFRSLMERSYKALSRNPPSSITSLELKGVMPKNCSAWNPEGFHAILRNLSSFTLSLRGGDNGAGWQVNMQYAYLEFCSQLDTYFFKHLNHVKHFSFSATRDGPIGIEDGLNNAALPLLGQHMPHLTSLSLACVFISENLAAFIIAHNSSLESVRFDQCFAGSDDENALCWGAFFTIIASGNMTSLKIFDITVSDLEQLEAKDEKNYYYDRELRARELRAQFPERRMFDYKVLDDKYGMVFDHEEVAFERFEGGGDHMGWVKLCAVIQENVGRRSWSENEGC